MIKFASPVLNPKINDYIKEILESGVFVHGKFSQLFEEKFKDELNYKYVTSFSSATTGLHLSHYLLGQDLSSDKGEVICPAMSHVATAHSIEIMGLRPVFVDANIEDGNISVAGLSSIDLANVRGMTYVHFNGVAANVKEINTFCKSNSLYSVEDCAIALGASIDSKPVGLWGDFGAFSFHPVKQLTTGEGGMVVSNSEEKIKKIKKIKAFGVDKEFNQRKVPGVYDVDTVGTNYRLAEIPAAIGLAQLEFHENHQITRQKNFLSLRDAIKDLNLPISILGNTSSNRSYYNLIILLEDDFKKDRNDILLSLKEKGLETSVYYPHPIPRLKYYRKKYGYQRSQFPNAEKISDRSLCLPIGPHLSNGDLDQIVSILKSELI